MLDFDNVKVYVDSDGVLADFNSFVLSKNPEIKIGQPGCGKQITKVMVDYYPELYLNFNVIPHREWLFKNLIEKPNWFVLTAIPRKERLMQLIDEEKAIEILEVFRENKYKWYEAHGVNKTKVIVLEFADLKVSYALGNNILFDDFEKNINAWNKNGGIGIHVNDSIDFSSGEFVLV